MRYLLLLWVVVLLLMVFVACNSENKPNATNTDSSIVGYEPLGKGDSIMIGHLLLGKGDTIRLEYGWDGFQVPTIRSDIEEFNLIPMTIGYYNLDDVRIFYEMRYDQFNNVFIFSDTSYTYWRGRIVTNQKPDVIFPYDKIDW